MFMTEACNNNNRIHMKYIPIQQGYRFWQSCTSERLWFRGTKRIYARPKAKKR